MNPDEVTRLAIASLLVAAGSLFVAGSSLVWQIVLALRIDKARLRCKIGAFVAPKSDGSGTWEVITISATNTGKRQTRLTSLWLVIGKPHPWWFRRLPSRVRQRFGRTQGLVIPPLPHNSTWEMAYYSSQMPVDLDLGGTASVHYPKEMIENALTEGDKYIYASGNATTASADSRPMKWKG